jgi:hypothetical protein
VRFVEVWAVCPVCRAGRRFVVCQWRFGLSGNPVCFQFFSLPLCLNETAGSLMCRMQHVISRSEYLADNDSTEA